MTKRNGTKRALLSSVVALFLCFSMLLGTTFAWFTDTVTSAGNVIQSGTLDVDLVDDEGNSLAGDVIEFVTADDRDQDEILWEPGCTYNMENVYVKNNGTLALKYEIVINGINGDAKLLEAIEWTVTVNGVETDLADLKGSLLPAGATSDAIVLSGHMKEDAGNEYQGLTAEGISVTVIATQLTYEEDSYNDQYDALATFMNQNADGEWVIETLGQLIYFAKSVNEGNDYAGETVILANDIDLAGLAWAPIGNWDNAFAGTFDGQGYTISNMKINNPAGEGVGFFGVVVDATIKGLTLENVDVNGYSMVAALAGAAYPAVISDCHVTGDINIVAEWAYVGGIAGYCYYGTQVDGCSVIADGTGVLMSETRNAVGGITAWLLEGDHKVTNCTVKNLDLTGWTNIGGISGFIHYSNTIDGCTVENVNITKTRIDGHPGVGIAAGGFSYSASNASTITNNTFKNITLNGSAVYKASANYLYGSEYGGGDNSNFVLSGNTEDGIVNNIVYVDAVATASSADELQAALNATGNVVVQLTNDIEDDVTIVSAADKKVIIDGGNNDFAGVITIDGKSATYTTAGFTIKNVNFVADSISADACIQLGDGTNATRYTCNVTVENCTFDVPGAVGVKSYTGGDKNLVIRDCTATANAHSLVQAKGIDGVLVENCKVYSKNGLNFNNSDNVTVVGCTVDVKGYAVRFGESSGGSGAAETYLIKDCSLTSANDDGDATIILRGTADNSTLTIENTTIVGTPDIANTAANATVIK